MAFGMELYLDSSILMGLTGDMDPYQALAKIIDMPSARMPSDHEPVLVSSLQDSGFENYFRAFPPCIDEGMYCDATVIARF
jgi:hypothetical protein